MATVAENKRTPFVSNVVFSAVSWAGPLALAFVTTPLLVRGLGVEQYGYYSLVLAIISFGFTTGIGKVSAKYIPECRAANESERLASLLSASLIITFVAAAVQGVLLAVVTPFLVTEILRVPPEAQAALTTAIRFTCLIGPVMMVSQIFQSAAQGLHLFRGFSLITNLGAVALNLGAIFLALSGVGYENLFLWNLAVAIFTAGVFFFYVRPKLPELRLASVSGSILKTVATFAASIFIYQSVTSFLYIFERAYIVRNLGSEALTYYVIPLMLGIYLHALTVSFAQVSIPTLNERVNDKEQLAVFYKNATRAVLAASLFIAVAYFSIGKSFLALWLGEDFASRSSDLLTIHGAAFALIAFSTVCWILCEAVHKSHLNAISSTVTCVVGIALILTLAEPYGLDGIAAARLFGAIVVIPLIFYVEKIVFGSVMTNFWIANVVQLAAAGVAGYLVVLAVAGFLPVNWPAFLLKAFVLLVTYFTILLLTGFTSIKEIKNIVPLSFRLQ